MQAPEEQPMPVRNGAELLLDTLTAQNVEMIFGYPGGAVLPLYDAVYRQKFRHILVRHEQAAAHAAEGYAKATGKPGVVFVTSGPGATNAITGIADAMMDSIPLVVFTGQVGTQAIGSDAFQEADILSMTASITKNNYQVHDVRDLPRIINEAFYVASTGRKGPVLIDLPKNIANQTTNAPFPEQVNLPQYQPAPTVDKHRVAQLMQALSQAHKPVLLVGNGVHAAAAQTEVQRFAQRYQVPVVATLLGLGVMPTNDPMFLGMGGMHGTYAANMALSECDLLINVGSRFDDRLATAPQRFAPHATIAHIDIDAAEMDKVIATTYQLVGDAKAVLKLMLRSSATRPEVSAWHQQLQEWQSQHPMHYQKSATEIKPQQVVELVGELTHGDAYVVTDVGQHQMWAAQYYPFKHQHQLITSGGLGTMGFGLPAAIGAKLAAPDKPVVLFIGDGGIQMTSEELEVIATYDLDIKIVLLNNHTLGMVRQWQDLFYDQRRSQTMFEHQPNFMKLAEAYGLAAHHLTDPQTVAADLAKVFAAPHAALIEVAIPALEPVMPMIAPGSANNEMMESD
ncbi:MAG: biosynthetic-type acetolactate synthase large subunit [Loigolactobacillus coryniformis]|uniref:Acetolactate synthase n=1 Tax=Loigolactobacillus coryniformis subsp. coryniformis CECT 5711 TaxID=1185325 RepID=J2Z458_9LACO|nr:biosynthetic-type acetolactate synthase large subunit [Loigolactobacillus coryniformis]EJN55203.1 Acetolactate synthase [Loigolactobacillus coryniformis subsp. coryniformis CECT 5711]MDN5952723.1 biosynthetic-type acetolactate synthase large subunit [Loigolactobacillus coryniformis]